jgi:hypothetical protein
MTSRRDLALEMCDRHPRHMTDDELTKKRRQLQEDIYQHEKYPGMDGFRLEDDIARIDSCSAAIDMINKELHRRDPGHCATSKKKRQLLRDKAFRLRTKRNKA